MCRVRRISGLLAVALAVAGSPSAGREGGAEAPVSLLLLAQTSEKKPASDKPQPPRLDRFGGLRELPSPNRAKGRWRVEKFGSQWMFVTPDGHAFWLFGVFNVTNVGCAAKYGDCNLIWGRQTVRRLRSWGFNTLLDHSYGGVMPWTANPEKMPAVYFVDGASYPARNVFNYCSQGAKLISNGLNRTYYTAYLAPSTDPYDPCFTTWHQKFFAPATRIAEVDPILTNPYTMGWSSGESDFMWGFGAGPDFLTNPPGHDVAHLGWLVLATAPTQTSAVVQGVTHTYPDPTVYAKQALKTFLQGRYATIAALNAAWASNYTTFDSAGGWGTGTGLMDEDGRHAWMGSFANLNGQTAAMKTDLNDFLFQYASKFFQVQRDALKAHYPNTLYLGPNVIGSWGTPPQKSVLQAAGLYVDVLMTQVGTGAADEQQRLDFTMQFLGDKPISSWLGFPANPDSAMFAHPNPPTFLATNTQASRGQTYSQMVNFFLNSAVSAGIPGVGGVHPFVGLRWWAWTDSGTERTNWGLVSPSDNAYDGREAIIAPGVDLWGYPTGGEKRNHGDFLGAVQQVHQVTLRRLAQKSGDQ